MHRTIKHSILFFAQRRPYELGSFAWTVDGKDPTKVTNWENWLAFYAQGALVSLSNNDPVEMPDPGAPYLFNYTFLDRFRRDIASGEMSLTPARLLQDFNFRSDIQMGLELVDILANATRQLLRGNLQRAGWANMHRLMIGRTGSYINFILYGPDGTVVQNAAYGAVVNQGFTSGGRPMLTRRNAGYGK